jgi:hypothetical protein
LLDELVFWAGKGISIFPKNERREKKLMAGRQKSGF